MKMDRNEIFSFIQGMIQRFYRSNDKVLIDKINNSTSFTELNLVPNEVARIVMSCEEKYHVDLGMEPYTSIQSVVDALMSVADKPVTEADNVDESEGKPDDNDQLPPPPESIEIPDMPATPEDVSVNVETQEEEQVESTDDTVENTSEEEIPGMNAKAEE